MIVHVIKRLLGLSNEDFMQHLGADVSIYRQTDEAIRNRLAELGVQPVGDTQAPLLMIKLSSVINMVNRVGAWEVILKMLRLAASSEPPVSANERGSQNLQRATQPWQPLPMLPDRGRDALMTQPEVDDQILVNERLDRGPAFVSTRMGRTPKDTAQSPRRWTNRLTRGGPLPPPMSRFGLPVVSSPTDRSDNANRRSSAMHTNDELDIPLSAKLATFYPPLSAFPSTLPDIFVPGDAIKTYGLGNKAPLAVRQEIDDFVKWSTTSIQLDRSDRYSAAVQRTTTEKHETCILAYLGFLVNVKGEITLADVSMSLYSDPYLFAAFLSFLRSRDVGRGHVLKHVSLARKVNNYLVSGGSVSTTEFKP